jgi:tol-pal system protein YbgF
MMIPRTVWLALLTSFLLGLSVQTQAGIFDDDEARKAVLDLRQKVEQLNQARIKDGQDVRDENEQLKHSLLDMQTLVEQLRSDLAKQVGQQEQLAKDVSDLQRRQRDLAQGVDDRIRRLEPVKVNPDGKEFLADPAEVKEFEAALTIFRQGEFKSAASAFIDFLRRYPQSGYQSIGLFWLGNAQYATSNYREAITNFKASIDANTSSNKAPEAMLAMANCQMELKDTRSARKVLDSLIKTYPQSEAAAAAKDRLSRLNVK